MYSAGLAKGIRARSVRRSGRLRASDELIRDDRDEPEKHDALLAKPLPDVVIVPGTVSSPVDPVRRCRVALDAGRALIASLFSVDRTDGAIRIS